MAYTKFNADWQDFPNTSTPITADALDHIETGILNAHTTGDDHNARHEVGGADELTGNLNANARVAVKKAGSTQGTRRGVNFVDGSGITINVVDDAANEEVDVTITATVSTTVPTGGMIPYGGSAAPADWLLCDGSAVSRTTFASLFAVIGVAYGAGDGTTTFNVPDMRGRVPVGRGSNASVDTLGESDGVSEANRRPQHRHTPHSHTVNFAPNETGGGTPTVPGDGSTTIQSPSTSSVDGGSGNANDSLNAPAYLVHNFIIKT